jgi:uncharacterized membrane protein
MSTDVRVETVVARPRAVVARYMTDWRNEPTWMKAIRESELITAEPFGVGARVKRVASFLGKRVEYVNEVVELDPDARLVMRSVEAPFPMTVTYEFEDADGGTRVRIHTQGDAGGFYRLAAPALSLAVRRSIGQDLANVKKVLEAR